MNFKKIIVMLFIFVFIINPMTIYADDNIEEELDYLELEQIIQTSGKTAEQPKISSRSAVVIDRESKMVLYEKNSNSKRAMASTTKIMTAIITLENGNLSDKVTVSQKAGLTGGSRLGLKSKDQISLKDLLYGLMLCSGNDAAVAIAEHIGGSIENFAVLMNKKADELSLKDTNFITPHGLDSNNHYTTAYQLAILTDYALNIPEFSEIVSTKSYTVSINGLSKNISNTNELLGYLNGVNGVKTGFTNNAGRCLVTSIQRDNLNIICVVLGADTKKIRTADSVKLIEYVYANYKQINIKDMINEEFTRWKNNAENVIMINKGKDRYANVIIEELGYDKLPLLQSDIDNLLININNISYLDAPVRRSEVVGNIEVNIGMRNIINLDILIDEEIPKKEIINYLIELLGAIKIQNINLI